MPRALANRYGPKVWRTVRSGARRAYRGAVAVKRYHDDFKRRHPYAYRAGVGAIKLAGSMHPALKYASRYV